MTAAEDQAPTGVTIRVISPQLAVIDHHEIHDSLVVRHLSASASPNSTLDHILRLGAGVLDSTGSLTVLESLDSRISHLVSQLRVAEERIDARTAAATDSLATEVSEQVKALGRVLSLDDPAQPMARMALTLSTALDKRVGQLHEQLVNDQFAPFPALRHQIDQLAAEVTALRERLAEDDGRRAMRAVSPAKGFEFEELATKIIGEQARLHGDVLGVIGTERGSGHQALVGDARVLVNQSDTGGLDARMAWEFKATKLGMRKLRDELTAVQLNRSAAAAIAVFASAEHAPKGVAPFAEVGHRQYACVLDGDPAPLQYMYRLARLLLLHDLRSGTEQASLPDLSVVLRDLRGRMSAISNLKRHATELKGGVEKGVLAIHEGLDEHRDAIVKILDRLEAQLSASGTQAA